VGLPPGVYTANVVFQSVNTSPQFVNVPVTLVVGNSSAVKVNSVVNAASFAPAAAPGGYIAVSGTGLAPTAELATVSPLPFSLSGVSATVNGVPAPIEYISSTQLNVQVPYETPVTPLMPDGTSDPAGLAVLGIVNNGKVTAYNFQVFAAAPGLFVGNDGAVVPQGTATRGGSLFFYITGEGDLSPAVKTGVPPTPGTPAEQLPRPLLPVSVTIGGVPAQIDFVGNVYAGVTQLNITVPKDAPLGKQDVVVTIGNAASKPGLVTVVP
jgi:uncharacterized protein (TIGR03437 family)